MKVPEYTEDVKHILEDYKNRMVSIRSLSRKYGYSQYIIKKILVNSGVRIKPTKIVNSKNVPIDPNIFDKIDDELSAYTLGLMWADGYNNKEKSNICISLVRSDSDILKKLSKNILGFDNVKFVKKKGNREDSARLHLYGEKIVNLLDDYGMNTLRNTDGGIPNVDIPKNIFHHFLRGLWDGDGSIYYIKYSKDYATQFIGSPLLCEYLKMKLKEYYNFEINIVEDLNYSFPMKRLNIHGNRKLEKFLDLLYENSNLYMKRKREVYIELKKHNMYKDTLPHPNKGTIVVRDKNNKCFRVDINDKRYVSGELIFARCKK